LGEFDLPGRLAPQAPRLAMEFVIAAAACGLAAVLRIGLEAAAPGAPAFVMAPPAVLLATMLAGWRSGIMTLVLVELAAWWAFSPSHVGFGPFDAHGVASMIASTLSDVLVIALAQGFRSAARVAETQRTERIETSDLLLRELNHRVRNNLQMVAGLLEMQRRTAAEPVTVQALESVILRVHSLARAHEVLYAPSGDIGSIDFARYLQDLCRNLSESLLLTTIVQLRCTSEPAVMPTDRAATLGLVINELVTNAAKHAFPDGRSGVIDVTFVRSETGWRLTVADDGVGLPRKAPASGMGRRLVDGFVRQAGGTVTLGPGPGASFVIDLPP
jgi:two-component sensor histidine kinase